MSRIDNTIALVDYASLFFPVPAGWSGLQERANIHPDLEESSLDTNFKMASCLIIGSL